MRPNVSTVLRDGARRPDRASPTSHATASARRPSARTAVGHGLERGRGGCTPPRPRRPGRARPRSRGRYPGSPRSRSRRDRAACRPRMPIVGYWMTECGVATSRVTLICSRSIMPRYPRRDLVLPVVALVDRIVEALALRLALEPTEPHVHALVLLAGEATEDHHAHLDLERDDLLFHALDPLVALSGTDVVLPAARRSLRASWGLGPRSAVPAEEGTPGPGRPECMIRFLMTANSSRCRPRRYPTRRRSSMSRPRRRRLRRGRAASPSVAAVCVLSGGG